MRQFSAGHVEATINDGLLLYGGRLLVPISLRMHVLPLIYDGHLGVNPCHAIAKGAVWWPIMWTQIENMAEKCPNCSTTRVKRA
ncbi:hypothetical protein MRX96_017142 [Rhipicephalus microplus]